MEKVKTKILYDGIINFEKLSSMQTGEVIYVSPEKSEILRSRASETNTHFKRADKKDRWTTNTRTANLGYISVTKIN